MWYLSIKISKFYTIHTRPILLTMLNTFPQERYVFSIDSIDSVWAVLEILRE